MRLPPPHCDAVRLGQGVCKSYKAVTAGRTVNLREAAPILPRLGQSSPVGSTLTCQGLRHADSCGVRFVGLSHLSRALADAGPQV